MEHDDPFDIEAPAGKAYRWARKSVCGDERFDETPLLIKRGWNFVPPEAGGGEREGLVLMECSRAAYDAMRDADREAGAKPSRTIVLMMRGENERAWPEGPVPTHPCRSPQAQNRGRSIYIQDWLRPPVFIFGHKVPFSIIRAVRRLRLFWYGLTEREFQASIDGTVVWNDWDNSRNNTAIGPAEYARRKRLMKQEGRYA